MPGINNHSFKDIGYSHDELRHLLNKIDKGQVLSVQDYDKLINEIGLDNISTFSGNFEDLYNLPDFNSLVRNIIEAMKIPTSEGMTEKIELAKAELTSYVRKQLEFKADIDHTHSLNDIDTLNTILSLKSGIDHAHDEKYYTKDAVDKKIQEAKDNANIDTSSFATTEDLSKVNDAITLKADKDHIHEMNNINGLEQELSNKADKNALNEIYKKADVYNKTEVDAIINNMANNEHDHNDSYFTKEEVENNFINVNELLEYVEDYATKEQLAEAQENVLNKVNEKAEAEHTHDEFNKFDDYYLKEEVDNKILEILEAEGDITINLDGYVKKTELDEAVAKKADIDHTHEEFAAKEHEHVINIEDVNGLQEALDEKSSAETEELLQDIKDMLEEKADTNHEHEEYALMDHGHTIDKIEGLQDALNNKADVEDVLGIVEALEGLDNKADKDHVHEDLAKADHIHENLAEKDHVHEDLAAKEHVHEDLAKADHTHEEFALEDHVHDDLAAKEHTHELFVDDVNGLQTVLDNKIEKDHVYSKEEVDNKILEILEAEGDIVIDLEGYIKQSQLDEAMAGKADVDHTHDGFALEAHRHELIDIEGIADALNEKVNVADAVTKEELANKADVNHAHEIANVNGLQEALNNKANAADLENLVDADALGLLEEKVNGKADAVHTHDDLSPLVHLHNDLYYTKVELDNMLAESGNGEEILSAAKLYTDEAIADLAKDAPEDMNTFAGIAEKIEIINNNVTEKADVVHEHEEYVTIERIEEMDIFETDQLTVNTIGGISAGSDLNGLTVKEVLNKLLFPYVAPTVAAAGTPNGGVFEKGNNQAISNVKVTVTKKSEKITKIEVLNGSTVLATQEDEAVANGGTFNFTVAVPVNSTNVQLTARVTDASGATKTATTGAFTFVYPYYVGVCDAGATINADLIAALTKKIETKGTKTISYTVNNQRMIMAYPKSYGVIAKIIDPNNFDVTSTFERTEVTLNCLDGTKQVYYVFVNGASSVEGFAMKFSY